jgi:hypothetical protein
VRGVPEESERVKSSASAPTCGIWTSFMRILQTTRPEGSAGTCDSDLYLRHRMLLLPLTQRICQPNKCLENTLYLALMLRAVAKLGYRKLFTSMQLTFN